MIRYSWSKIPVPLKPFDVKRLNQKVTDRNDDCRGDSHDLNDFNQKYGHRADGWPKVRCQKLLGFDSHDETT